ncbi:MAG: glycosyltransferase, partial [Flavobacteriaceae bacterium CG02_land_8_20_14_3_00_34_13]
EQGNAKDLAKKITKLINDKTYYTLVVDACQKRAAQYDIHKMVEKHIALYESICYT